MTSSASRHQGQRSQHSGMVHIATSSDAKPQGPTRRSPRGHSASAAFGVEVPMSSRPQGQPQEARFLQRREDRVQQRQAFQEWLRCKRTGGGSPSSPRSAADMDDDAPSHLAATEADGGSSLIPSAKVAVESDESEATLPPSSQMLPGGRSPTESPVDSARPLTSLPDQIALSPFPTSGGAVLSSLSLPSFPAHPLDDRRLSKQQRSFGSEGASDLLRAGAVTDASTCWGSPGSSAQRSLSGTATGSARTVAARAAAVASEVGYRAPSGTPPHPSAADEGPSDFAPEEYCEDDIPQNVSIGDRIEGIRACLEARLGADRFQELYTSLSLDGGSLAAAVVDGTVDGADGTAVQAMGLSDQMKEDLGSLAPLVAKLVDCEQRYFS